MAVVPLALLVEVALAFLLVALLRGALGAGPPGIVNLEELAPLVDGLRRVEGGAMREARAGPPDDEEEPDMSLTDAAGGCR